MLLLGTGESGKTTFVKQMKILYSGGFTDEEKAGYRVDIINNVVDGMTELVTGMATLGIQYKGGDAIESLGRDLLGYKHREGSHVLGPGIGTTIKRLWGDAGVKECFARRHQLQIPDCVGFFLDNIDRIVAEKYEPTNEVRPDKSSFTPFYFPQRIFCWLGSKQRALWNTVSPLRKEPKMR